MDGTPRPHANRTAIKSQTLHDAGRDAEGTVHHIPNLTLRTPRTPWRVYENATPSTTPTAD